MWASCDEIKNMISEGAFLELYTYLDKLFEEV
jgi:hypothetical protein